MSLKFHPDKTHISHTLHPHEGRVGFDFLGFTMRQFPAGKYRTAHNTYGSPLGFKTLIMASQKSIQRQQQKLKQIIQWHLAASQSQLIDALNPVISGLSLLSAVLFTIASNDSEQSSTTPQTTLKAYEVTESGLHALIHLNR